MIIAFSGKKGSGKDTAAAILETQLKESGFLIRRDQFAARLKKACSIIFNTPMEYFEDENLKKQIHSETRLTYRQILQKVGTDLFRNQIDSKIWARAPFTKVLKEKEILILTDLRFRNEAEQVKLHGGKIIRINRPGLISDSHISETEMDDYGSFDYVIHNDGTLDQLKEAIQNLNLFKLEH